jgi:hypothetical protein
VGGDEAAQDFLPRSYDSSPYLHRHVRFRTPLGPELAVADLLELDDGLAVEAIVESDMDIGREPGFHLGTSPMLQLAGMGAMATGRRWRLVERQLKATAQTGKSTEINKALLRDDRAVTDTTSGDVAAVGELGKDAVPFAKPQAGAQKGLDAATVPIFGFVSLSGASWREAGGTLSREVVP